MINIGGKDVYTTLEEIVNPIHTALLVIDVQNDFCSEGGVLDQLGNDLRSLKGIVPNVKKVIQSTRSSKVPVIYLRFCRLANHHSESPASLHYLTMRRGFLADKIAAVKGTWGAEIVNEVTPLACDLVIDKQRSSSFYGTNLNLVLKSNKIETVILTGVVSHGCVEATARDAESHDYYIVALEDCIASFKKELHDAAITIMKARYHVVNSDKIIQIWKS